MKKCKIKGCEKEINNYSTYCVICANERKRVQMYKQIEERKRATKLRNEKAEKSELPEWMLVRGNISNSSKGSHFG